MSAPHSPADHRAPDVVRELAALPRILTLTFRAYRPLPPLRERGDGAKPPLGNDPDLWRRRVPAQRVPLALGHLLDLPPEDGVVALSSEVETVHGRADLLLLDFACPPSETAQAEIEAACRALGWTGWLLVSGASYHFIGDQPMGREEWVSAMGAALLIPGIDYRYIGHRLIAGAGAVRLSTCPRKPHEPVVVARLGWFAP